MSLMGLTKRSKNMHGTEADANVTGGVRLTEGSRGVPERGWWREMRKAPMHAVEKKGKKGKRRVLRGSLVKGARVLTKISAEGNERHGGLCDWQLIG